MPPSVNTCMSLAEALSGASNVRGFAQKLLRNREERSRFNLHALLLLLDCLAYLQLEARIADKAPRRVWKKYAEETYAHPESLSNSNERTWRPPLPVSFFTDPLSSTRALAEQCLISLDHFEIQSACNSAAASHLIDTLLASNEPIFTPFDEPFYRNIGRALRNLRKNTENLDPTDLAHMFRSIMTSVLEQHLGSQYFGQRHSLPNARTSFATDERDSAAIHDYYLAIEREQHTEESPELPRHRTTKSDSDMLTISPSRANGFTQMTRSSSTEDDLPEMVSQIITGSRRRRAWSSESQDFTNNGRHSISHADDTSTLRSSRSYGSTAQLLRPQSLIVTPTSAQRTITRPLSASPRSPGPFQGVSVVPTDYDQEKAAMEAEKLPPTVNDLSPDERRDLVKRSKKLQQKLGVQLNEEAARKALQTRRDKTSPALSASLDDPFDIDDEEMPSALAGRRRSRSSSFPPPSPTSPTTFSRLSQVALRNTYQLQQSGMNRSTTMSSISSSSSAGGMISATEATTSPETSNQSPVTPFEFQSIAPPWKAPFNIADLALKEERRRRVQKVYALLGECVPVHVVLGDEYLADHANAPSVTANRPKHARTPSRFEQASGVITRRLGMLRKSSKNGDGTGSTSSDEDWQSVPFIPAHPSILSTADGEVSIEALRRAQKLERLLGELPPQHLNPPKMLRSPLPAPRHSLDTASINTDDNDDPATDNISALIGKPIGNKPSQSSLRRTSLAALQLQYLAENQPQILAKTLSQVYGKENGPTSDEDSDFDPAEEPLGRLSFLSGGRETRQSFAPSSCASAFAVEEPPLSAMDLRRSMSARSRSGSEGQRQLRKAAKLARFFGTTKGEVLTKVLEDLENEIEEDEHATMDERLTVLAGVRRLRSSIAA